MADSRIAALTEFTGTVALDDVFHFIDVSDTTDDATGSSYKLPASGVRQMLTTVAAQAATTDTLADADAGVVNYYTATAQVTVTIPTDAADDLDDGFTCTLVATGAGGLTLSLAGITVLGSAYTTIAQGEAMTVIKTTTANTWLVLGGSS